MVQAFFRVFGQDGLGVGQISNSAARRGWLLTEEPSDRAGEGKVGSEYQIEFWPTHLVILPLSSGRHTS